MWIAGQKSVAVRLLCVWRCPHLLHYVLYSSTFELMPKVVKWKTGGGMFPIPQPMFKWCARDSNTVTQSLSANTASHTLWSNNRYWCIKNGLSLLWNTPSKALWLHHWIHSYQVGNSRHDVTPESFPNHNKMWLVPFIFEHNRSCK